MSIGVFFLLRSVSWRDNFFISKRGDFYSLSPSIIENNTCRTILCVWPYYSMENQFLFGSGRGNENENEWVSR